MGAFRPVTYSAKELKGMTPTKRKALKKAIVRHIESHPEIRKILRKKTRLLFDRLKVKK
jgi:formaldehyde-activating enzyme involved in methanogenesis